MTDRAEALREEIARIAAPMMEGGREFDQCPPDRIALRKWNREGMCSINDATQDDALTLADALIPIITRERERAARAALEAAGHCVENNPRGMFNYEDEHADAIRALSPADIVKGMK